MEVALRSVRSVERVFVRFVNATDRNVEIVWINFSGQYVCYRVLPRGSLVDVNTYKTHPWIALDSNTKDRLLLDKKYVFIPRTTREYFQERHPNSHISLPENYETRIRIFITLPLYSLRYRTLLEIRNNFETIDDVDSLELPRELLEDLKKVINQRNTLKSIPIQSVNM